MACGLLLVACGLWLVACGVCGWWGGDPWRVTRGFCSSIDLHRISLVRSSKDTFRTDAFDALEGTRVGCLLAEPTRRRPVQRKPRWNLRAESANGGRKKQGWDNNHHNDNDNDNDNNN